MRDQQHRAVDEIAADLSTCITEAQLERTELVVLGHSLGGIVSAWLPAAGIVPDKLILLDPPVLTTVELEAMTRDPEEQPPMGRDGIATATQALRAAHPDWSDGDVMAKVDGLLRFDVAAVRAVLLGNGAYDAGLTGLANPAARDVAVWYIRGEPASGGLIPDDHVPAIEARVGPDHLVTIAGAGHSPQRTHIHSLVAAILNALA